MAVNVQIIGRLGADAEMRTSKNGNAFVAFRVATDEYRNGNNETVWMNVSDNTDKTKKMSQYLTKGKMVCVYGTESVSIYHDKNGAPQVSRDIWSDRVDFVNAGNSNNAEQQKDAVQQAPQQAPMGEVPPVTCGTLKPTQPMQTVQQNMAAATSVEEDDLPF